MRKALFFALPLVLAGCARQDEMDALQATVRDLRAEQTTLRGRVSALEVEVGEWTEQAEAPPPPPPQEGSWIAWETRTYSGNMFVSPPKPKPVYAFSTQAECIASIRDFVKTHGGDEGNLSMVDSATAEEVRGRAYACLPKGVDPR